jgi:cilia- and flagella-associated protein 57
MAKRSITALTPKHVFGINDDINSQLHFIDDNVLLYPSGHMLVLLNTETQQQQFIQVGRQFAAVNGNQALQGRPDEDDEDLDDATRARQRHDAETAAAATASTENGDDASQEQKAALAAKRKAMERKNTSGPSHTVPNEITAIAVSHSRKYVAVAIRGDRAAVIVYDTRTLKPKKMLSTSECLSNEYVSIAFSHDDVNLATQSAGPDYSLIVWNWRELRPIQISTVPVSDLDTVSNTASHRRKVAVNVSFSPVDRNQLFVQGLATTVGYTLNVTGLEEHEWASTLDDPLEHGVMTAHTWYTDKVCAVGTSQGQILLYHITDGFVGRVLVPQNANTSAGASVSTMSDKKSNPRYEELHGTTAVSTIVKFSKGLLVGTMNGLLRIIEGNGTQLRLTRSVELRGEQFDDVQGAVVSSSEDTLILCSNSQLFSLSLADVQLLDSTEAKVSAMGHRFHDGPITGLDVCARKPILVTTSQDHTIRIWNYVTNTMQVCKTFSEMPQSVSLHPSGLHIIVGFEDKLRLMNILLDDLRTFMELPVKNCRVCQFSHGGHSFAVAMGSAILVYDFYSGQLLQTIRGHNGMVSSISWSLDDHSVISAGMDGAVYERRLSETHRHQEWVQKSCRFSSAVATVDGKLYAVGDDRYLKEITDSSITKELHTGSRLTQVVVSRPPQRMLFVATEDGFVRSFKFPITGEYTDFHCYAGAITQMCMSHDDAYLFVAGANGSLSIFEVQERKGRLRKRDRADAIPFAQEVLVTRSDLEEKHTLIHELKNQVDELTVHNAYQLRLHDITFQDKLKEVTEKYNLQLEHQRSRFEMLHDEKQDVEAEYEDRVKSLEETQSQALRQQDIQNQKRIMEQVKRFHELEAQRLRAQREHELMAEEAQVQHERHRAKKSRRFCQRLEKERAHAERAGVERDLVQRKFNETRVQLEEDTDKEIEQLKTKYDDKLNVERDATLRLKGENGIMKKKFSSLKKDIEDQKEEIKYMLEKESQLTQHIAGLENEIRQHKREIDQRDFTIGEKETEIYDLKKDNQELEKFKFVLDNQIKDLKRQIEPRENEIEQMKEAVMQLDSELEMFHREKGVLQAQIQQHETELSQLRKRIAEKRRHHRYLQTQIEQIRNDLELIAQHVQNPTRLSGMMRRLNQTHVPERITEDAVDPDVQAEYLRQQKYLESRMNVLKSQLDQETEVRTADRVRIMQENLALLNEINELRRNINSVRLMQRQEKMNVYADIAKGSSKNGNHNRTHHAGAWDEKEASNVVKLQQQQIAALRVQIEDAQKQQQFVSANRPVARAAALPPLDDYAGTIESGQLEISNAAAITSQ